MMETRTYKVYKFDELPEDSQQKAIVANYDINIDGEWFDFIFDDVKSILDSEHGIEVGNIYFSGFSSQGDGACFEGSIDDWKQFLTHFEVSEKLRDQIIAENPDFSWSHRGHYYHENCLSFNELDGFVVDDEKFEAELFHLIKYMIEHVKDRCTWLYSTLEDNHDYLTTDEAIKETLVSNEYDFTLEGEID